MEISNRHLDILKNLEGKMNCHEHRIEYIQKSEQCIFNMQKQNQQQQREQLILKKHTMKFNNKFISTILNKEATKKGFQKMDYLCGNKGNE